MDQVKGLVDPKNYEKFDRKIVNKEFLLGKFYHASKSSFMNNHQCSHKKFTKSKFGKMLSNQLKVEKIVNVGKEKLHDYEFYLPLNELWQKYMKNLIQNEKQQQSKELKILRGDFHGAHITVVESKNPTMIGLSGIVIKQSLKCFEIIGKATNKTKKVIKQICIFLLTVDNSHTFLINGNSLVYRPSDRMKHKYKFKKGESINFRFLQLLQYKEQQK